MKHEFDPIDELLQEKVEDTQIPFKEEYWTRMSMMLDNEEKTKRKPFPFWRGLSILIMVLATGAAAYLAPPFFKHKSGVETKVSPVLHTQEISNIPQNLVEELNNPAYNSTTSSTVPENGTSNTEDSQVNPTKPNSLSTPDETINPVSTAKNQLSDKGNHNPENSSSNSTAFSNTPNQTPIKSQTIPLPTSRKNQKSKSHANNLSEVNSSNRKNNEMVEDLQKSHVLNVTQAKGLPTTAEQIKTKKPLETQESNANQLAASYASKTIQGKKMNLVESKVTRPYIDPSVSNPRYQASLSNYIPEKIDSIITLTYQPVQENQSTTKESSPTQPAIDMAKDRFKPDPIFLFTQVGLNINKGLNGNTDNPTQWAFSPYVGLGVEKEIRPNISISANVGFTYFNGLNLVKKANSYKYSFGVDSTETFLFTKKLFQFYLPVTLYYQFMKKHTLFCGLGTTYSFSTSGTLVEDTYNAQPYSLNSTTNTKSNQTNQTIVTGYSEGINSVDFFLQAGYTYNLFKNVWVQAMVQQGFLDISKNSYYNNSVSNTLTRFSLGFKYNFKRNSQK